MLRTLREPRYAALSLLMVVVAAICIGAGTWQISRLEQKISANDALRANAHAPAAPIAEVLPLTTAAAPAAHQIQFRTVTATGSYDSLHQSLVRQAQVDSDTGWYVLTPLRTGDGVLLVVRGFISGTHSNGTTPSAPSAPAGTVSVTARAQPGESRHDDAAQLTGNQVESINPGEQAARLGLPVFAGYAALEAGQPGTANLVAIPGPDLSNPAGGAVEPQHVAYVIQWYLFAALALAAPFVVARAETRGHDSRELGEERPVSADEARAARLADRYGRPVR